MEKRFDVPEDLADNNCMMNKISKGADFVIFYGELSAGYNERGIMYNPETILEEGYNEIELTREDLVEALEIFEEEFLIDENCYILSEINTIRKWIEQKSA
tara:strand:+ start:867 stop:1169 length:303 start_codon:yes stop_codon:yes gene_type:complete